MIKELKVNLIYKTHLNVLKYIYQHPETYTSEMYQYCDCTYSHSHRIIDNFYKAGLVEFNWDGRKKKINLTTSGKKVYKNLKEVEELLDESK